MTDFRATQRTKIFEVLTAAGGDWVPLPKILVCAAQYNARIHELRCSGFNIENRTTTVNKVRHSWFRLAGAATKALPRTAAAEPQCHETRQPTLFPLSELERTAPAAWRDPEDRGR